MLWLCRIFNHDEHQDHLQLDWVLIGQLDGKTTPTSVWHAKGLSSNNLSEGTLVFLGEFNHGDS